MPENTKKNTALKLNLLFFVLPFLTIGIWMLASSAPEEHQSIERGSVYFVKEIWGRSSGLTIFVLSFIILIHVILNYRSTPKSRPSSLSHGIYKISLFVLIYVSLIYGVIILQYFLVKSAFIANDFAPRNMYNIHFFIITIIIIFSISAFFSWLIYKLNRK